MCNNCRNHRLRAAFSGLVCFGVILVALLHRWSLNYVSQTNGNQRIQEQPRFPVGDIPVHANVPELNIWDQLRVSRPKPRIRPMDAGKLVSGISAAAIEPQCDKNNEEYPTTYDGDYRTACPDKNCSRIQRIPKLLHCSWESDQIPLSYATVMRTFTDHHPDWHVMFWSDSSIAWFLEENYPAFYYSVFMRYKRPIERVDSFRYFVLYHYGGVYADSDFLFFRSLDPFLHHHAVLPREPEPNALALLTNTRFMASNAIMMTAPRHPLFLDVILHLQHVSPLSSDDYLFTAGPLMMHRLFGAYELRRTCTREERSRVYAPPSHYFWPYTRTDFKRRGRDVFVRRWCEKFDGTYNRSNQQVEAMCEDPTDVDSLRDTEPKVTPFTSHLNKVNYPGMRVESDTGVSRIEDVHPNHITYADLRGRVADSCFSHSCSAFLHKHRILPYCLACYDSIL